MTRNKTRLRGLDERELDGARVGSPGKCSLSVSRKTSREKCPAQEVNAKRNTKERQLEGMCKVHCNNFSKR